MTPPLASPSRGSTDSHRPLHLLLVEDGPEYALLVEEMLREAFDDLDLTYRARISDAESALRAGGIDCVLLDLGLPDASGLEGLERVQQAAPEVPVVVLSGVEREETAVQAVHDGAQDYVVKRHAHPHRVARSIRYAIERKQGELELERKALQDELTGLANRTLFMDRVEVALAHMERSKRLVAILFLDLDRFKQVNDSLGHEAGDILLREVADRLRDLVRPSDAISRFGGDEFLVLCDDLRSEEQAVQIAERLSVGLSEPILLLDREVHAGASIGIAFGRDRTTTAELLVREADQAMYHAKQSGTGYEVFEGRAATGPGSSP
jgi:diguanylate cyclase (GGDEF)-like protein